MGFGSSAVQPCRLIQSSGCELSRSSVLDPQTHALGDGGERFRDLLFGQWPDGAVCYRTLMSTPIRAGHCCEAAVQASQSVVASTQSEPESMLDAQLQT